MQTQLTIDGMTCSSCVASVRAAIGAVPGVKAVEVDLENATATVASEAPLDRDRLTAAVAATGKYRVRADAAEAPAETESLYPLFLIVGFLLGTVVLVEVAGSTWRPLTMARHFMAGFFLVFAFFKLLDLRGFVDAYRGYDLVARALPAWAWVYPFVELALGIAYLLDAWPVPVNATTLLLMLVGALGVLRALRAGRTIRCACLGTALNLPMTTVTLIEDLVMAAMAAVMLWVHLS